jgi:MerR family copper efflux transcriptional regulator
MARTHLPLVPEAEESHSGLIQVGELAQAVGKTVRAIHHYEELGLLEPDARSKGRFRLYDQDAVTRVRWIAKLHDLGLSLTQIQEVVSTWEHSTSAARANATIREMYAAKLEDTRTQIERLHELERELEASISYLDACEPCDTTLAKERGHGAGNGRCSDHAGDKAPEVGSCVTCDMRERDQEPELVAGLLSRSKKFAGPQGPRFGGSAHDAPTGAGVGLQLIKTEDPKR